MINFEALLDPEEKIILDQLSWVAKKLNVEAFLVGGFVRDKILNRGSKDIDVVCLDNVEDFARLFQQQFYSQHLVSVFKNFGTAHLDVFPLSIEFVGARKESYNPLSRNPLVDKGSFMEDQLRRDFTINTLAVALNDPSKIIDSFNGIEDIEKKIIKTPTNPDITFFDDPLRILRAVRFACQLNFEIASTTFNSMQKNVFRIDIVAKERIAEELNKMMMTTTPSKGFILLQRLNLLNSLLPELTALNGVECIDGIKHKNNFFHSLQVLDNICLTTKNVWLRWAALLHDIGKTFSKKFDPNGGWTFHGHEGG